MSSVNLDSAKPRRTRSAVGWSNKRPGSKLLKRARPPGQDRRLHSELGIDAPADLGSMIEVVRRLDWDSASVLVGIQAA
jgi:hypothetical protein